MVKKSPDWSLLSVGSTTAYVQRKLPASGVTVTDTGSNPAWAGLPATAAARTARANRRMVKVLRSIGRPSVGGESENTGPIPVRSVTRWGFRLQPDCCQPQVEDRHPTEQPA